MKTTNPISIPNIAPWNRNNEGVRDSLDASLYSLQVARRIQNDDNDWNTALSSPDEAISDLTQLKMSGSVVDTKKDLASFNRICGMVMGLFLNTSDVTSKWAKYAHTENLGSENFVNYPTKIGKLAKIHENRVEAFLALKAVHQYITKRVDLLAIPAVEAEHKAAVEKVLGYKFEVSYENN